MHSEYLFSCQQDITSHSLVVWIRVWRVCWKNAHSPTSPHQRQLCAFQLRQRSLKRTPCHNYPTCTLPDTLIRADKVAKRDFLTAQLFLFLTQLQMNRLAFVQIAVHHTPDFQRQLREESCLPLEVGARVELPVRDGSQADS